MGPRPAQSTGTDEFRHLMSHYPTGVVAITGARGDEVFGLTVGSFFSISLEPYLIGFSVGRQSTSWPAIEATGGFCVNVLAHDQSSVSLALATRGQNKFDSVGWRFSDRGLPVIDGALASIECTFVGSHEAGDHSLVIGEVMDFALRRVGRPLVFYRRAYCSLPDGPA